MLQIDHLAQFATPTEVTGWSGGSSIASVLRTGNIVIAKCRYDSVSNGNVMTGVPKAKYDAYGWMLGESGSYGRLEISAGNTTITYVNLNGTSNKAKWGSIIYIADDT